jgi:hypothetical protein
MNDVAAVTATQTGNLQELNQLEVFILRPKPLNHNPCFLFNDRKTGARSWQTEFFIIKIRGAFTANQWHWYLVTFSVVWDVIKAYYALNQLCPYHSV